MHYMRLALHLTFSMVSLACQDACNMQQHSNKIWGTTTMQYHCMLYEALLLFLCTPQNILQ